MAMKGTEYESHSSETIPSCWSISGSSFPPMLTCIEIASTPSLMLSRTLAIRTFLLGDIPMLVLAESWMIIPISTGLLRDFMIPFWTRNAVAPPLAI